MKKIIITADDLGIDKETNTAIEDCFRSGVVTSSCIISVGNAFDDAVEKILNKNLDLEIGVHIDIIEGKALTKAGKSSLTDENGFFNNSFLEIILKSFNKKFLEDVENEINAQIEKVLSAGIKPAYINSHVHTHSIPNLFKLFCKSAEKYSIPYIRMQNEIPYITAGVKRHLSMHYCLNIVKNVLLNIFSLINRREIKKHNLKTNQYFLGVLYTGQMDEQTIISGIEKVPDNSLTEIICHPSINPEKPQHYKEYESLTGGKLKNFLKTEKIIAVNWKNQEKKVV